MDLTEELKKFAEYLGIDEDEVDKYMSEQYKVDTLNDLLDLPTGIGTSYSDLNEFENALPFTYDYILENKLPNMDRHEILTLDSVLDSAFYGVVKRKKGLDTEIAESFKNLTLEQLNDKLSTHTEYRDWILICIELLETQFCECTNDW